MSFHKTSFASQPRAQRERPLSRLRKPWIHPGSHFDPDAITQARMRLGYADGLANIGCLDKIQCDDGPVVTLVARILSESITLIAQDPGLQITTVLYLLECPAPYFFGPLLLLFIGKACGSLPENENERFLHLTPCNSVPMALWPKRLITEQKTNS